MSEVTLLAGAVWGIAGAIAMMIAMQALGGNAPPPFAVFWSKFVGGDPADAMPQSLLLHVTYALVAGVAFVALFTGFDLGVPITGFTGGIIWGLVWGVVLMLVAMVVWVKLVLGMNPTSRQKISMLVAHLAYGVTLGVLGAAVPHPV